VASGVSLDSLVLLHSLIRPPTPEILSERYWGEHTNNLRGYSENHIHIRDDFELDSCKRGNDHLNKDVQKGGVGLDAAKMNK